MPLKFSYGVPKVVVTEATADGALYLEHPTATWPLDSHYAENPGMRLRPVEGPGQS